MKCWFDNLSCLWRTNKLIFPCFLQPWCFYLLPPSEMVLNISRPNFLHCYIAKFKARNLRKKLLAMEQKQTQYNVVFIMSFYNIEGYTLLSRDAVIETIQYGCQQVYKLKSKAYFWFWYTVQTANTSSYQILGSSAFFMNDIIEARKTGVNSLEIGRFLCILFQYSEVPKNSFRNVKLSCLRTALLPMEVLVHHTMLAGPPGNKINFPFPLFVKNASEVLHQI